MKLSARTITERFRQSGRKVTPQRVAVFEVICERSGHPTVDQIYQEVRQRFPMISLNTVYQIMDALVEMKMISRVHPGQEATRYETDVAPHHHAVCLACRRITDVFDPTLGRVRPPRAVRERFQVLGHRIEFFGYCSDCQTAEAAGRKPEGRSQPSLKSGG